MQKMCVKISYFILISATAMMIKNIASETALLNANDVSSSTEMKDTNMINFTAELGRNQAMYCPIENRGKQITWLKNNKTLQDSEDIKILKNGQFLKIINVNLNSEGNYTCKNDIADCQPFTYQLFVHIPTEEERIQHVDEHFQEIKHFFEMVFKRFNIAFGNDKQLQFEKQDLKTDVQKVSVDVGKPGRFLVVVCSNQNDLFGTQYTWLKNNNLLESDDATVLDGHLLIGPLTEKHSGNYTCKCKDISCIPYSHTYQVELKVETL